MDASENATAPADLASAVLKHCRDLGFELAGVAPVRPAERPEHIREWLNAGRHGDLTYLQDRLDVRLDPGRVFEGTRSFIVVADLYSRRGDIEQPMPGQGRVARYARGGNYHDVVKRRLHKLADALREACPGSDFRSCVDTVPILERELGELSGLGWIGKNTMLINPRIGSYFVLGVVATNLELAPAKARIADHCGTCTRCIDACPTRAITPFSVDASRCISYLTIERRGIVPRELHAAIGDWVFGCDICQEVCPHNSARPDGMDIGTANPEYAPRRSGFDLLKMLSWDHHDRADAFRSSAMKRVGLAVIKRNAIIAAANAARVLEAPARDRIVAAIRELASSHSEPELVRRTATEVLSSLDSGSPG